MAEASTWRQQMWRLRWRRGPRAASKLRLQIARTTHGSKVRIPPSVYAGPGFRLELPGPGSLTIGEDVLFRRGFYCEISGYGAVSIGARSNFAADVTVQCSTTVEIGSDCVFATSILIADGAHRFRDWKRHINEQGYEYRPITIGEGALIHAHCTIVANIGRGAVIGANSLVNRDVPDYCLAGGVPARVLEYFGPPEACPPGVPLAGARRTDPPSPPSQ